MIAASLGCFTLALREQRLAPHVGCTSGTSRYRANIPLCSGYYKSIRGDQRRACRDGRRSAWLGRQDELVRALLLCSAWCPCGIVRALEPVFVRPGQKSASGLQRYSAQLDAFVPFA